MGRGGMAEVYLGRHTTLNRPVAVKILHGHLSDDETLLSRFRSEAQAVAGLRHPNIVQVLDFDIAEDQPYIVMELVEGMSLAEYLLKLQRAEKRLTPETIVRLFTPITSALDYAHGRGIVHRDVKPANVLLRSEGGEITAESLPPDAEPVLTDFGVARIANASIRTASGAIVGTPAYMSPEQVSGEIVDSRSDIYSLGIMLYEMLTGRLPFESESESVAATLIKQITEQPPPMPEVSPSVQSVVFRALAKDRTARYQKAGDLAVELRSALGLPLTPVEMASLKPAAVREQKTRILKSAGPKKRRRRPLVAASLVVLLAILIGAGVLLSGVLSNDDDKKPSVAAPETYGLLQFESIDHAVLTVTGLPQPPEGQQYEAWLLGQEARRGMGPIDLQADGSGQMSFTSDENLLNLYDRFEITLEPQDSNPVATGDTVYSGAVPAGPLVHIKHLLVSFHNTPDHIGLVTGLMSQTEQIEVIAADMQAAFDDQDLAEVKRQAEGLINLIEGSKGEHFGDLDGDSEITNLGDGYGLLPSADNSGYIQTAIEHANYAATTEGATDIVIQNAERMEAAAQNLGGWAAQLREIAVIILANDDLASISAPLQELNDVAALLMNGDDFNGSGSIEPGEGGVKAVLDYALRMVDMPVIEGAQAISSPAASNVFSEPEGAY
jgi:serine/threonine protein kinase